MYAGNRNDLDDLFQDIVLNVWRSFDAFRGESKMSTWLYRIALNTTILNYRKASRNIVTRHPESGMHLIPQSDQSVGEDDFNALHSAIRQLPEIDRAIILLYLEEQPGDEIARITGLSPGNIRVRISRIKNNLKTILENQGYQID
jgi:RNA polymerase sigma-70 factor (ECF subfamily)